MNARLRWDDIRTGFERPFWIANTSEIFERFSYYAVFATLTLYLHNQLKFSSASAATLSGIFGGAVWVMPIFGGVIAARIGFRRALSTAYFVLTCAYLLIASIGAPWLGPVRDVVPLGLLAGIIFFLPALGIGLVKPSVVGTVARSSKDNVRSIGYSIYYTMVNAGSFFGPIIAGWVQTRLPTSDVYLIAAASVAAMFFVVLAFFREPRVAHDAVPQKTLGQVGTEFLTVLGNWRFMLFVLIFSGYWIVYWQQYVILGEYLTTFGHVSDAVASSILSVDPFIVISLTVLANVLIRRVPALQAVIAGTVITALGWLVMAIAPTVLNAGVALGIVAIGEIVQSPRYYEYVARVAPAGQEGLYLGFAFLPIGIGGFVAGTFGGNLFHHYGEVLHRPGEMWLIVTGLGVVTGLLLFVYDRLLTRNAATAA